MSEEEWLFRNMPFKHLSRAETHRRIYLAMNYLPTFGQTAPTLEQHIMSHALLAQRSPENTQPALTGSLHRLPPEGQQVHLVDGSLRGADDESLAVRVERHHQRLQAARVVVVWVHRQQTVLGAVGWRWRSARAHGRVRWRRRGEVHDMWLCVVWEEACALATMA